MNTVLLVDDDPVSARLIKSLLQKPSAEEFKVQHADRLGAALSQMNRAAPDLVLLDLPLPDGEGLDALRQVRAAAPHIPTVVLTDFNDQALGSQAIEAGAQDHLVKAGLDRTMLVHAVRHAIKRQRILAAMEAQRDIARREVAERQKAEAMAQAALEELRTTEGELGGQNEALRTAQAEAEAERGRYQTLFDLAPDGYLETDVAGIIQEANRAASRLLKLDRASLLQAPLAVFVAKADLPAFLNQLAEWQKTGAPEQAALELSLQPRGSASFPAAITAGPAYEADGRLSGLRWLLHDISEHRRMQDGEAALSESEEGYRSLFEAMQEGYAYCHMLFEGGAPQDFVYLAVNAAFERMTGLKEVAGKPVSEVIPGLRVSDPALFEIYGRVALSGVPEKFEMYVAALQLWFSVSVYSPRREYFVAVFDVITERKQAEAQLRSQAKLLDNVSDAIIAADGDYRLTSWNAAAEAMYGWKAEEVLGRFSLDVMQPQFLGADTQAMVRQIIEAGSWRGEATHARKDGTRFPVELASLVFRDQEGQATGYLSVNRDITARKRGEERIAWLASFPEQNPNPEVEVDASGAVQYMNPAAQRMFPDLPTQGFEHPWLSGLESVVAGFKSQRIGAQQREVRVGAVWFAQSMHYVPEVERMRIYGNDITERKKAEESLQESEKWLRAIFDQAGVGVAQVEIPSGRFVRVNQRYCDLLGYTEAEMQRLTFQDITPPEDLEADLRQTAHLQAGEIGQFSLEKRLRRRDGSLVWVNLTASPLSARGEQLRYHVSLVEDITERKQAEEALRVSEARYRSLVETQTDAIARSDLDGKLTYVNDAYCRALGRSAQELLGAPFTTTVMPEDLPISLEVLRAVKLPPHRRYSETREHTPAGLRWFGWDSSAVLDPQGNVIELQGVGRDITERKKAEEKLRESEFFFKESQRAAFIGSYKTDFVGGRWESSEVLDQIFGIDGSYDRSIPGWLDIVHPDDRETMDRYLREEVIAKRAPFNYQYRIIRKSDGEVRWVHGLGGVSFDVDGNIVCMIGTIQDITERKQGEAAQRRSEAKFKAAFMTGLDAFYIGTLEDGRLVESNNEFEQMFGYTREEMIGKTSLQLNLYYDPAYRAKLVSELQARGRVQNMELKGRKKSGEMFLASLSASLMQIDGLQHILGVIRDITERKRIEAELKENEDKFQYVFDHSVVGKSITLPSGEVNVNQAFCEMIGCSPAEIRHRKWQALTHPDDIELTQRALDPLYSGEKESMRVVKRYLHKNGAVVWADVSTSVRRDEEGKPLYFMSTMLDITERKQAEEALKEERNLLLTVIDQVPDSIFVKNRQSQFLVDNKAHLYMLNAASQEAVLGKTDLDIFPYELAKKYQEDERKVIDSGQPLIDYEELAIDPDGRTRTLLTSKVPLRDNQGNVTGLVGIARDITERKTAEEQMRRFTAELEQRVAERTAELQAEVTQHRETEAALDHERRLLRTVIDTVPDHIFACGRDGRFTLNNRAEAQMVGAADPEALLGKVWDDVFPPALAARYRAADLRVMETGEPMIEQEEPSVGADGARHWLLTSTVPLRDCQGQLTGLVGIARDITRHKEAEAALTALNGELTRALRVKDEFLATMSHELRTPLTAILGLSETLQMGIYGALTEKQNEVLAAVYDSGQHLLDLINEILDLSKIEAGKMELQIERILVADVCLASVQFVKPSAQRKNLRLVTSLDAQVTAISADVRRFKQILVNLLSNAVKFTADGGEIGLSVEGDPALQVARFTVWDTGIGITQADMQRLFQPFVQLDSRLARAYNGTGLGLSLVRRMADLHGGSVTVESDGVPGKGSRFTVTVPWQEMDEPPNASQPEALAEMPLNLRHALTVEDAPVAAEQLTRYLTALGIQNTVHPCGAGAFETVLDLRPDVVLLDILLPEVSGWEVLRQLKGDARTRDIPVVVISVVDDRPRSEALGADAYLVKPVAPSDLQKALRQSAERAGLRSAQSALVVGGANRPLILVADDNATVVMALGGFLKARDHPVVVARDGAEAMASARQYHPGLILMDIQMPGVDGLEAIRRLRADPDAELAATPIIALTALVMPGDRERCLEAGANEYLTKPVKWARLIELMEGLLKRE